MSAPYRLYGADLSPYSQKVRTYLAFKGVDFEWIQRSAARQAEFARYAKLPLIPVLVGADESVLQDSTPMIAELEARHPEPSIIPEDPALGYLSALIEDYADEWLNKAMFHYRWTRPVDQESAARRIVAMMFDGAPPEEMRETFEAQVRERMTGRLHHVGSNPVTAPAIEASLVRLLALLEKHLASRPYLFGGRPGLGDFGLAAQLAQLLSDPTPGALIRESAPRTSAYLARMEAPKIEGEFEPLDALIPTLAPLVESEIVGVYLPWMAANGAAVREGEGAVVSMKLDGAPFEQQPQRYSGKAYIEIKKKRQALGDNAALAAFLDMVGAEPLLAPPPRREQKQDDLADPDGGDEAGDDDNGEG
jgi:glutathione S-transferase